MVLSDNKKTFVGIEVKYHTFKNNFFCLFHCRINLNERLLDLITTAHADAS